MVARAAADAGLPNLVLTHFSPRYQGKEAAPGDPLSIVAVEAEARAQYDGRLFLARDLERYRLDRQGVLARFD
jgi:ribonuclease Z